MEQLTRTDYIEAVKAIRSAIQRSRYNVAKLMNREVLGLYYWVGHYVSVSSRIGAWKTNAIATISQQFLKSATVSRRFDRVGYRVLCTCGI